MTTVAKKTAAKKVATKTTAKKPVPKKSVAKKIEAPAAPTSSENRVLYTIRLEPSVIAKLTEKAKKLGTTHAAISREILRAGA